MKLEIFEDSKNYVATVINLPPKQKVEGLDNLVKVTIFGNDCLVSKEENETEMYLFFPAESQLSHEFLSKNNLYRDIALNENKNKKGFFEPNRRVKALKFKGIISSGFVIPMYDSLHNTTDCSGINLKVGDEFNSLGGIEICRKYVSKAQQQALAKGDKVAKINNKLADLMTHSQFRFHDETSHLAKNLHQFNPEDIIVITDKWHGSSCILSKVLINKKLNWWQKILNKIGGQVSDRGYAYIYSSGKPKSNLPKGIEGEWVNDNKDYYIANIWKRAFDDNKEKIEDGISIYGELVGFTEGNSYIQSKYDYGCEAREYKLIVYRITYTKPDGSVIEFTWQQIKNYCKKYELEHVKELYHGKLTLPEGFTIDEWFNSIQNSFNLEKDCKYCRNKVPAEGIVVRKDGQDSFMAYKLKAKKFLKMETEELDKEITTNIEDNA